MSASGLHGPVPPSPAKDITERVSTVINIVLPVGIQGHLQKTKNPLRPIVVIKEGQENRDFSMALAA